MVDMDNKQSVCYYIARYIEDQNARFWDVIVEVKYDSIWMLDKYASHLPLAKAAISVMK